MSRIALWPVGLPLALRTGHGYEDLDTRAKTEMTQGPPRMRSFFKNNPRRYTLQFLFRRAELELFEHHYTHTCAGGTKPTYVQVLDHLGFRSVAVLIESKGAPRIEQGDYFSCTLQVISYDQ